MSTTTATAATSSSSGREVVNDYPEERIVIGEPSIKGFVVH